MRLRTHLALLVLAVLLPLALFSAATVALIVREQREARLTALVDRARETATAADGVIEAEMSALQALATSRHLVSGSLERAYDDAARVAGARRGWVNVALLEPSSGRQIFNLLRPFGASLPPTGSPELLARVVSTGQPAVSGVFDGVVSARRLLAVGAPVFRDGQLRYVLGAGLRFEAFSGVVAATRLPAGSTALLLDGRGVVIGASGSSAAADEAFLARVTGGGGEGVFAGSRDGVGKVYTVFSRSPRHGLLVALSVPARIVDASTGRSLWGLGGAALAVLASALVLAFVLSRRLTGSVTSLWRSAGAPDPRPVGPGRAAPVLEVAGIARAMQESGDALRRSRESTAALGRLKRDLATTLDPRQVVTAICKSVPEVFGVPRAVVYGMDQERGTLICRGVEGEPDRPAWVGGRLGRGLGVSGRAALERRVVWSPDVLNDPAVTLPDPAAAMARGLGYGAMAAAPLIVRDEVVGVLTLVDVPGRTFSAEELTLLETVAADAALAVDRARLHDEARRRRQAAEALTETARRLSQSLEPEVVSRQVLESLLAVLGGTSSILCSLDPDSGDLVVLGIAGEARAVVEGLDVIPRGTGVLGLAVERRATITSGDVLSDPRVSLTPDLRARLDRLSVRAGLATPLVAEGRVIGAVAVGDAASRRWTPDDVSVAETFADLAALALQNATLFRDLRGALETLRALSRRLVDSLEAERRRIALELHDEIGQLLTGLKMALERAGQQAPRGRSGDLAAAQELAGGLITRVREMALDLRPAMLDDLGLVPALLWQLERYTMQTSVQVTFKHSRLEDRRFPAAVELAAYRIVQEGLTNVARHSGASHATVIVSAGEEALSVEVADEGTGFDVGRRPGPARGAGLAGMRERVAALGGSVEIQSAPGAGTRLVALLPLGTARGGETSPQ